VEASAGGEHSNGRRSALRDAALGQLGTGELQARCSDPAGYIPPTIERPQADGFGFEDRDVERDAKGRHR